ncbi:bifunctional 3-phenylpropionate/cinnamic acid dioxygenase ferredoxin subunit [Gordonia McavH-238-E]|uniref:bifunctional 3-phenylpropionate/cinnamic acid dioxygenase ferredoxin subunit n=1 Tax=Gordonia sp. McavH-238-E TaxID=2917736 RepID=UPI001EF51F01|nr:bifunctional 3-phenylpropionate/cinnamic acid dioxygenase ferredoxin subunit [Gordonia sp. McavH-238-E]MCG7632915.1 bifunctional 3-phenylpropionate/cinnamic acid dioxygenase ferredoxin subunit [Gordonia sp. McavH-238-E]
MAWTKACATEDVPVDEGHRAVVGDKVLAVFNVDGEFFATDDVCTHGESSLSEGYVEPDCSVECVAHMARFSLKTGEVLAPPATIPITVYPVRVDDGIVMVDLDG